MTTLFDPINLPISINNILNALAIFLISGAIKSLFNLNKTINDIKVEIAVLSNEIKSFKETQHLMREAMVKLIGKDDN